MLGTESQDPEPSGGARTALIGVASAVVLALFAGAAWLVVAKRPPDPPPGPPPTPSPVPLDVTPARLAGVWVGTFNEESLVLTVSARAASEDRVECALNAGTRELIAFEAMVERHRGLAARDLPGYDLRFGPGYEDENGRLAIPLLDEEGRVRARLTQTESSNRR